MPIDWAAVDWLNVSLLSAFAFLAAFMGNVLSFRSRLAAGILTALLFAAIFIFWTYYLHGDGPDAAGKVRLAAGWICGSG